MALQAQRAKSMAQETAEHPHALKSETARRRAVKADPLLTGIIHWKQR